MNSSEYLARLVAFPSVSERSNRDVAAFIADVLRGSGVDAEMFWTGEKVNLFATLGPADRDMGIILSGHMDVVPTEGQTWTSDPFHLQSRDGRLYGRGAADMKGFLACVLSLVERLRADRLKTPLHLCFSHDEEIGCVGVRPMLATLAARGFTARACIVGEPTGMKLVAGHKGKLAAMATCRGVAGHSALAPRALNAIHMAVDVIGLLRDRQSRLEQAGARDEAYDIPYTTIHVGLIRGGTALNIVPDHCTVDFEIRAVGSEDPAALLGEIARDVGDLQAAAQAAFPLAGVEIETVNSYPGLDTSADDEVVAFVGALVGSRRTTKVAFGTEGGLFKETLGVPTVICGPGSMEQGHKADEFVAQEQLDRCDAMLDRLVDQLS